MTDQPTDNTTGQQATESIRMPARQPRSCGFVRLNEAGALEIELYDHGDSAHSMFDSDVATIYTVAATQWPMLTAALQERQAVYKLPRTAAQVDWADTRTAGLPRRVADSFLDVDELLQWLTNAGVQLSKRFDSWA